MANSEHPPVSFSQFSHLRASDEMVIGISNDKAVKLARYLPMRFQIAIFIWSSTWMLSIPVFLCVSIFYRWWIGLLLLLFVVPFLFRVTKRCAALSVIKHAENDEEFFNQLVEQNLLVFKSERSPT